MPNASWAGKSPDADPPESRSRVLSLSNNLVGQGPGGPFRGSLPGARESPNLLNEKEK